MYNLSFLEDILEGTKVGFIEIFGEFDNWQFECF